MAFRGLFSSLRMVGSSVGRNVSNWIRKLPFTRTKVNKFGMKFNKNKPPEILHANPHLGLGAFLGENVPNLFSVTNVFLTLTMLSIVGEGFIFSGQLPFEEFDNGTFTCKFKSFEKSKFQSLGDGGQLFIDDKEIPDGSCKFRKVSLPFLFMEMWDGVIEVEKNVKTKFYIQENAMDRKVPTEFSQIIKTNENLETDIEGFMDYDIDLKSTTDFTIDINKAPEKVRLQFTIDNVGSYDFEMKANETFDDDTYPLVGTYEYENKEVEVFFNLRRPEIPFYIVTNGVIDFKQPKNGIIKSIIFATDGKEMRFQGTKGKTSKPKAVQQGIRTRSDVENSASSTIKSTIVLALVLLLMTFH